jgi:hypothetical protein
LIAELTWDIAHPPGGVVVIGSVARHGGANFLDQETAPEAQANEQWLSQTR